MVSLRIEKVGSRRTDAIHPSSFIFVSWDGECSSDHCSACIGHMDIFGRVLRVARSGRDLVETIYRQWMNGLLVLTCLNHFCILVHKVFLFML
jgi:hypothetical protein